MSVLIDSSAWVNYFRGLDGADEIDVLIEENLVATNDLVLAELIPPLHIRKQKRLVALLGEVKRQPMNVDWDEVVQMQITCLKNGINRVGIPDLMIAQNAIQGGMRLLANDKHFGLISQHVPLMLFHE